ncbi:MAG: polysaccharide biosynthesis/export family protein [Fidelibacterota bacterium]
MKRLIFFSLIMTLSIALMGQDPSRLQSSARANASRYILSSTGDALLMTVKVWGEVQRPGLYDVPIGTDLIELLSSAGGPKETAQLSKIRVIRSSTKDREGEVFKIDIKHYLDTGDESIIPEIKADDTVIIPMKPSQYIRISLSWTQQLMSLIQAYALADWYLTRE